MEVTGNSKRDMYYTHAYIYKHTCVYICRERIHIHIIYYVVLKNAYSNTIG